MGTFDKKALGQKGESLAKAYLEKNGFEILAQNVMLASGEIDIVARIKNSIAIAEVKTSLVDRFNDPAFAPELRVNSKKQQKLRLLAQQYFLKYKVVEGPYEIDVVGVEINPFGAYQIQLWRQAIVE